MKKIITLGVLALLAPMTFGQTIDDLLRPEGLGRVASAIVGSELAKRERGKLDKFTEQLNADQSQVLIRNMYVVASTGDEYSYGQNHDRDADEGILTSVKAIPVWNDQEIKQQADSRRDLRGNDEVDQGSLPGKNKIKYAGVSLESTRRRFSDYNDLRAWWRRTFGLSVNLELSRETSYTVLTHKYRDVATGGVVARYVTIGSASTADNVFASLATGFLGNSFGVSLFGDSSGRRASSADRAAEGKMMLLLKEKKAI